jgi:superfamily II helicase
MSDGNEVKVIDLRWMSKHEQDRILFRIKQGNEIIEDEMVQKLLDKAKMITMNDEFDFKYNIEICCDECNEPIHTHFDCPICKEFCGTDWIIDGYSIEKGETFKCEECKSEFVYVGESKIRLLKNGKESSQ